MACLQPAKQNCFGERKVCRVSHLEILPAAGDQFGRQAERFDGAGLIGYRGACRVQRLLQQADTKHLRRLRQPLVAARQRAADTSMMLIFERIGQFVRQQPAHLVVLTGVDQLVDLRRRDQAAGGVVDQHPVVRFRAGAGQRIETLANADCAAGAAGCGNVERLIARRIEKPVAGTDDDQRSGQSTDRQKSRQRVQHHRLAGKHPVLLGLTQL